MGDNLFEIWCYFVIGGTFFQLVMKFILQKLGMFKSIGFTLALTNSMILSLIFNESFDSLANVTEPIIWILYFCFFGFVINQVYSLAPQYSRYYYDIPGSLVSQMITWSVWFIVNPGDSNDFVEKIIGVNPKAVVREWSGGSTRRRKPRLSDIQEEDD